MHIIGPFLGDHFNKTADYAHLLSIAHNCIVQFRFNGITCHVWKDTNLELLYRDYLNADKMGRKSIGPDTVPDEINSQPA